MAPNSSGSGVIGIVVLDDAPLAGLVRASENPAHTKWLTGANRLKERYTGGPDRVQLVVQAPRVIVKRLLDTSERPDMDLLSEFFPDPSPNTNFGNVKSKRKRTRKKRKTNGHPPEPGMFIEEPLDDGVLIKWNPEKPVQEGQLHLKFALSCVGANPFDAWQKFDFVMKKGEGIKVEVVNGNVLERKDNSLIVQVGSEDFELRISGFPTDRDLEVRRWFKSEQGVEE